MHEAADAVDPPGALLHRGRSPGDTVVHDPVAKRVQVFPLLEHVGAGEDERKAGHPKLSDESLVHATVHPAHGDLLLQGVSELRGQGRELSGVDVRKVDGEQQVERGCGLRELVEGVQAWCLPLLFEKEPDELARERLRRAGLRLCAEVERRKCANGQ